MDEVIKLLTAVTGDRRMVDSWLTVSNSFIGDKEDSVMGEKWIDELEKRGEKRGRIIGEKHGKIIGEELGKIIAYNDVGLPIETIAEKVGISIDRVKQVLGSASEVTN